MIMRFRGKGVGHSSTRAATNIFKADRDILDMKSHQGHQEQGTPLVTEVTEPPDVEEEQDDEEDYSIAAKDLEADIDEGELSESELIDYGYELEDESDLDLDAEDAEEDGEGGEEDDTTLDELDVLSYADH